MPRQVGLLLGDTLDCTSALVRLCDAGPFPLSALGDAFCYVHNGIAIAQLFLMSVPW
jgi:hypothetical protein